MDVNSKVEFLKFHQGYVRGVAFSPVVRIKLKYVLFDASVWNVNMLVIVQYDLSFMSVSSIQCFVVI